MTKPENDDHDHDVPTTSTAFGLKSRVCIVVIALLLCTMLTMVASEPIGTVALVFAFIVVPIAGAVWIAKSVGVGDC